MSLMNYWKANASVSRSGSHTHDTPSYLKEGRGGNQARKEGTSRGGALNALKFPLHPWQQNANTCPQTARHFYSLDSILVLQFYSCLFLVTGLKDYLWWLSVWHLSKECLFSPDWTCFRQKQIRGRINNQYKQSKVCCNYSCNMEVKIQTWKCLL